jgi:hypothetical protein
MEVFFAVWAQLREAIAKNISPKLELIITVDRAANFLTF